MTAFILLAILFTIGTVAVVTVPLVKHGVGANPPAPKAALVSAGVIVLSAAALYLLWSNWTWRAPADGNLPQNMVARLARQLERNPDDLQGWMMLGHSYVVLEQLPLALRAYERADRLADGKNVFYLDIGKKFLKEDGTLTKDIMPDLLHLSPAGYEIWAASIEPSVVKLMAEKE